MICTASPNNSLTKTAFGRAPAVFFMNTWYRVDAALQERGADDANYGEMNLAYFQLKMSSVDKIVSHILRCRKIAEVRNSK